MSFIFLVDDEEAVLQSTRRILTRAGHTVEAFRSPGEALQHLSEVRKPDLMILDLNMPDMDGRELFRRARRQGYVGRTLILSAFEPFKAMEELGADDALEKPFEAWVLLGLVSTLIGSGRTRTAELR
jgi:DNA-binding response OmpR family regulator